MELYFLDYYILFTDVEEGAEIHVGAVEPPADGKRDIKEERERGRRNVWVCVIYYHITRK